MKVVRKMVNITPRPGENVLISVMGVLESLGLTFQAITLPIVHLDPVGTTMKSTIRSMTLMTLMTMMTMITRRNIKKTRSIRRITKKNIRRTTMVVSPTIRMTIASNMDPVKANRDSIVMRIGDMMKQKAEGIPVGNIMVRREENIKLGATAQAGTDTVRRAGSQVTKADDPDMGAARIIQLQVMSRSLRPTGHAASMKKGDMNEREVMGEKLVTAKKVITVDVPATREEREARDMARSIQESKKGMEVESMEASMVDGTNMRRLVDMTVKDMAMRAEAMGVRRQPTMIDQRNMVNVGDTAIKRVVDTEKIIEAV